MQLQCFLECGYGFGHFPASLQIESQIVVCRGIIRLDCDRLAVAGLGFPKPPLLAKTQAKVVVEIRDVRAEVQSLPDQYLPFCRIVTLHGQNAEILECNGILRVIVEDPAIKSFGGFKSPGLMMVHGILQNDARMCGRRRRYCRLMSAGNIAATLLLTLAASTGARVISPRAPIG